jgi:chemotaxis protein MotB
MAEEGTSNNKKKESSSVGKGVPPWITTYSDLVTLMLAFFVILLSFGTFEKGRIVRFVGSFQGAFKILPGGFKIEPGEQIIEPSKDIVKTFREPGDRLSRLKGIVKKEGLEQEVEFRMTNEYMEIVITDYLLFGLKPGSADIVPEMKPFLDELAEIIRQTSCLVSIEGHTDDRPLKTRKFPSSWDLSAARAVSVLRYLINKEGVSPLRLSAKGFGEYRPLFPNDTEEYRARNRRVTIYFESGELEENKLRESPLFKEGKAKVL